MNRFLSKGAITGFLLTLLVLLGSGAISYRNIHRLNANEGWVVHTYEVLDVMQSLLTTLVEAETAQRGYIITGQAGYLPIYRGSSEKLHGQIARLKSLTADNPVQQRRLVDLTAKVQDRIDTLQKGMDLRTTQGLDAAAAHVTDGVGKQQTDDVRALVAQMKETEMHLLAMRDVESAQSYQTALITISLTTVLGIGLVAIGFWLAAREVATRRKGIEALARANDFLEQRVEERTADLASANLALTRSNRELEQFASVASHDLQEPLRKIQAFGDRLETKCAPQLGEQGRDYLRRMLASAGRMRSLIDALLTFSRVTTKAQPFVPVDLSETATEVVADLEEQTRRTSGSVEIGSLPTLEADPLQMRQLLQNLIGNGLKFSRPGEPPHVQVESRMLKTDGENGESQAQCEIAVSDNGIGFDEVYLNRIFELFQRLHGRQDYEGTGMGLAICRKIVERHGGTITARSAPERGTTFLVPLPLTQQGKK